MSLMKSISQASSSKFKKSLPGRYSSSCICRPCRASSPAKIFRMPSARSIHCRLSKTIQGCKIFQRRRERAARDLKAPNSSRRIYCGTLRENKKWSNSGWWSRPLISRDALLFPTGRAQGRQSKQSIRGRVLRTISTNSRWSSKSKWWWIHTTKANSAGQMNRF